eukprot:59873_1
MDQYDTLIAPYVIVDPDLIMEARCAKESDSTRFLRPRILWSGGFFSDLWMFIRNNHIVIGILLKHPDHPLARRSRLAVLYCSLCASLLLGFLVSPRVGDRVSIVLGLSVLVYVSFIKMLGTFGKGRGQSRLFQCFRCMGRSGMFAGVIITTFIVVAAYGIVRSRQTEAPDSDQIRNFVVSFAISQGSSWVLSLIILIGIYTILRYLEKKEVRGHKFGSDFCSYWLYRNEKLRTRINKASA